VVGTAADVWVPLSMQPQVNPGDGRLKRNDSHWLLLMGRRKPGVTLAQARAEITTLAVEATLDFTGGKSLPADQVREIRSQTVSVEEGDKGFSGLRSQFREPLIILMCVVGLVLLIACANIANLLLARASNRRKEMSVRLAAGASRFRLVRQLLTESVLLASIGGFAGVLLAWAGSGLLLRLASNRPTPIPLDVRPDGVMLAFTAGVSILTGILFGVVPALRSTSIDLSIALKESARSVGGGRGWQLGKLLVVGQVALSLLLLFGAGLFVRSLINLETLDVGYSRTNLVLIDADATGSGYAPARQLTLARQLSERLRTMPGVTGVAVSVNGLFNGTDSTSDSITTETFTSDRKEDTTCQIDSVGPRYFQVIGVPVLSGREFDEHDTCGRAACGDPQSNDGPLLLRQPGPDRQAPAE
jgi:predicted permease